MNSIPVPTIKDKVMINHRIRLNIQQFISSYITPLLIHITMSVSPHLQHFIQQLSSIWSTYQRFIFAHNWVVDKLSVFYENFHKMSYAKDFQYKGQVVSIPIIAVGELKKVFQKIKVFEVFPIVIAGFINKERHGIGKNNMIQMREMTKQCINAVQSCFYDYQAIVKLDQNNKPCIVKNPKITQKYDRRSRAAEYIKNKILITLFQDCQAFYISFVKQQLSLSSSIEQLEYIQKILIQQNQRAMFYFHSSQNRKIYIDCIEKILIGLDMEIRINKQDGMKKFLREYQVGKQDYKQQLSKFWKIYSKIQRSLPIIVQIYDNYLQQQAVIGEQKIQKFMQFIPQMIRINLKNIQIMQLFCHNFQIQKKRNQKIKSIFSNQLIKTSKFKGKHTMGAINLAQYINVKFKQIYGKSIQDNRQMINNVEMLFKILQQKVYFTKEHEKYTANRLLQDIDFNKDIQYANIISLEKGFIQQMQKQMGVSQIKQLLQNIKDIEKSFDHTKKLKQQQLINNITSTTSMHIFNQLIVKNNTFWPQKNSYQITLPNCLFKISHNIQNYFNQYVSKIQFEYQNGVSLFKGQYNYNNIITKQNFLLKNIYMIILLLLDEADGKKLFFGQIKKKIKSFGHKKQNGNLYLIVNMIELLHNGLIVSNTKKISKDDPKCFRIQQSDQFQLNRQFDYQQQMIKNKLPIKLIKKLPVIKTSNIQRIPQWLKKQLLQQSNQLIQGQLNLQKQRRLRVKQICVKTLKHAHHSNKNCNFEQIMLEYSNNKNKQFKVTEKYVKEIIEELINDQYCQRVEGEKALFKYKA